MLADKCPPTQAPSSMKIMCLLFSAHSHSSDWHAHPFIYLHVWVSPWLALPTYSQFHTAASLKVQFLYMTCSAFLSHWPPSFLEHFRSEERGKINTSACCFFSLLCVELQQQCACEAGGEITVGVSSCVSTNGVSRVVFQGQIMDTCHQYQERLR